MHTHRQVFAETERLKPGVGTAAGTVPGSASCSTPWVTAGCTQPEWSCVGQIHRERQTEAQGQTTGRPQTNGNKKEVALQALPTLGSAFL